MSGTQCDDEGAYEDIGVIAVTVEETRSGERLLFIEELWVAASVRRQGVASALLAETIDMFIDGGGGRVGCVVLEMSTDARPLYEERLRMGATEPPELSGEAQAVTLRRRGPKTRRNIYMEGDAGEMQKRLAACREGRGKPVLRWATGQWLKEARGNTMAAMEKTHARRGYADGNPWDNVPDGADVLRMVRPATAVGTAKTPEAAQGMTRRERSDGAGARGAPVSRTQQAHATHQPRQVQTQRPRRTNRTAVDYREDRATEDAEDATARKRRKGRQESDSVRDMMDRARWQERASANGVVVLYDKARRGLTPWVEVKASRVPRGGSGLWAMRAFARPRSS